MDSILETLKSILAEDSSAGATRWLLAFGISYLGGVVASLTPCVYPMIPITVGAMGGLGEHGKRHWKEVALRALAYILGMAAVYSFLGVLAGLTGKIFGSFTNTPGWYIALGIIMLGAALTMVGLIPFDPLRWWNTLKYKMGWASSPHSAGGGSSIAGAAALGMSSGLVAAPCTTPILTAVLTYIAQTQSIGIGLMLMWGFSLGLGTLLLMIALSAGMIRVLPRSGAWMNTVKIGSGAVLLGFAVYLFYRAGQMGGLE